MRSVGSKLRISLVQQLSGRILDCGSGDDLFGSHLRREGNEIVSLDVDEAALRRIPGTGVLGSCADMPFVDDYFDAVWACAIIEHVKEDTLPEMIRVTRVGGRIIAVTPNKYSPFDPLKRVFGLNTWWENEGHVRLYDAAELRRFGEVIGETWWIPWMGWFFRRIPRAGHVLILDIHVTAKLKESVQRQFPQAYHRKNHRQARVFFLSEPGGRPACAGSGRVWKHRNCPA